MREHRTYTQNDNAPLTDGDNGFIGVDMRTAPHLLRPGYVSEARNARFRYGIAEPRKGVVPLSWGRVAGFEFPIDWDSGDINWGNYLTSRFGKVYGVGVWNDPNGRDWIFVAGSTDDVTVKIWRIRQGNAAREVPVSVALTVPDTTFQSTNTEDVYWFTQAFDKCILSRGGSDTHLVLSSLDVGFEEAPAAIAGTENIPNAENTLFFQNRLLVPHTPAAGYKADHVAVSDILDYTSYDPVYASFKINQGDSDNIRRLYKYNDTTVVVFKDTSIYAVSNLTGDWSQNAILDQITTEYGLVGPRSVANTGDDLWFLSQRGVVSLRQTELNKVQGVTQPQSAPIQPIIDRIDFAVARETACGAYWRDRYYLSVPIDGSQQNNAVLVYDFLNQAWSGYDDGDAIKIKYLFIADFQGSEHLYYVDYSGTVGLYEFGELESQLASQLQHTCDLLVKGHPQQGSTLQVNGGTEVTVARTRDIIDGTTDSFLLEDDGDTMVEDVTTNTNDAESGWLWGVGDDSSVAPCDLPADNLYLGYTSDGWTHNTDSVSQLDCGVRFTNDTPILISTNDPYLQAICSQAEDIEDRPIDFLLVTRGYGFEAGNRQRFLQSQMFISTWCPKYKVTAIVDGVKEESVLIDDTTFTFPSRTKYLTFGIEDWAVTNTGQDHATASREDYSVILDTVQPGGGTLLDVAGTQLDLYQYWTHKLRVDRRGAYYQLKVEVTDGRVRLHTITSGNVPGQRRDGQHGGLW
jgi:hypothetical protein